IRIGGVSSVDPEFAGVIVIVQHRRRPMNESPWYDVQCIDSLHFFDARLVTWEYPSQSATPVIKDLVARFVPGCLTNSVALNLPVIPILTVVNQRMSTILRSITATIHGGFRMPPLGDLPVWAGPYKTRQPGAIVEGQRTDPLIGIPPGADAYQVGRISTVPIGDSSIFTPIAPPPTT